MGLGAGFGVKELKEVGWVGFRRQAMKSEGQALSFGLGWEGTTTRYVPDSRNVQRRGRTESGTRIKMETVTTSAVIMEGSSNLAR